MPLDYSKLKAIRHDMLNGVPVYLEVTELLRMIEMSISAVEAKNIIEHLVKNAKRKRDAALGLTWLDRFNAAPEAPCTAPSADHPELASHKDGATPAATDTVGGPPGQSTDDSPLPAQPPALPLSREERVCADQLADAAERLVNSFRDHLGRCQACTLNWQLLREHLGQYQSVTK